MADVVNRSHTRLEERSVVVSYDPAWAARAAALIALLGGRLALWLCVWSTSGALRFRASPPRTSPFG
jgi:hypothetical protein